MKGHNSQPTIENPFIKSQNKSWELTAPDSLNRSISPPPRPRAGVQKPANSTTITAVKSVAAAVEAGDIEIDDHVSFFSTKLWAAQLPMLVNQPRLAHQAWLDLYRRNLHDRGHHFVVHQHDHPIAGTHYDLRLQCNASSSISFAIMYGLPGDPNSRRLNRNATETRVHNLWNHLIETASSDTGTMLLWDTGSILLSHTKQSIPPAQILPRIVLVRPLSLQVTRGSLSLRSSIAHFKRERSNCVCMARNSLQTTRYRFA